LIDKLEVQKKKVQLGLFDTLDEIDSEYGGTGHAGENPAPQAGQTVLDRIHDSMILFVADRSGAQKRFLIEDIGPRRPLQASRPIALGVASGGSDEERWVDGVLAQKSGLGF